MIRNVLGHQPKRLSKAKPPTKIRGINRFKAERNGLSKVCPFCNQRIRSINHGCTGLSYYNRITSPQRNNIGRDEVTGFLIYLQLIGIYTEEQVTFVSSSLRQSMAPTYIKELLDNAQKPSK